MSGQYTLTGKNLQTALKMLKDVTAIFDKSNIKYSITAGTLLGIVREKRLLPWDRDMDLRVFSEDRKELLKSISKIKKAGYITRVRYQEKEDQPLQKGDARLIKVFSKKNLFFKGEVMMDCFIATKSKDQYIWSCGGERKYTKKAVPSHFYDNLEKVTFNNDEYFLPVEKEEYLKFRYGDWKTPKKKWRFAKDDGAIIYTDHKHKKKK